MAFLLIVPVESDERQCFVRRNKPNSTAFQTHVKQFLCGTTKIIMLLFFGLPFV
jgi:hypothetical protein